MPSDEGPLTPYDRVPPNSQEAERGVLGSILVDAERVIDLCIERQIIPESFYYKQHGTLFYTMRDMHSVQMAIDIVTLVQYLRDRSELEQCGGIGFIEDLVDLVPVSAHAEHYIDIVHQKHVCREIIDRSREAIEHSYRGDKDAALLLAEAEENFFSLGQMQKSGVNSWPDLMKHTVHDINLIFDNKKGTTGIPSGYRDLDRMLRGLQPADMLVLAARPSMGKTSLALNIAENVAIGKGQEGGIGLPVAVFSLEMSAESLVRRMLCCNAEVPFHALSGGGVLSNAFHGKLMETADKLKDLPLYIDDAAGLDILDLRARARRLHRKHGIRFIVVDYLQLMNSSIHAGEGRQRETAAISNGIKAMAKELSVPVLVLSQLSRAPETRDRLAVPKLSDLRDSGAIEQDADVVMLLRRPTKYPDDPESDDDLLSIIDVAKHRNGATGEVRMNFVDRFTRFMDRTEERTDGYDEDIVHMG